MLGYNLEMLDYSLVMLDYKLEMLANILVMLVSIHLHLVHMMVIQVIEVHSLVTVEHTCYLLLVTAYMANLVTCLRPVTLVNGLESILVRNLTLGIGMEKMLHCQVSRQIHEMA